MRGDAGLAIFVLGWRSSLYVPPHRKSSSVMPDQKFALHRLTHFHNCFHLEGMRWLYGIRAHQRLVDALKAFTDAMRTYRALSSLIWRTGASTESKVEPSALEVEVLAAATGRPLLVGGWDIVRNRPKPRLPAVPAGTVLVVRVPKGQARMLTKAVRAAALTDDLSWEGYGFVTLGAYCDDRLRL